LDLRNEIKRGDLLAINKKYLADAIDVFESAMLLILTELWAKKSDETNERVSNLHLVGFNSLLNERYLVCETINRAIIRESRASADAQNMAQVNLWLSIKYARGLGEIREEVEQWDVSALDVKYHVAKYAILNDPMLYVALEKSI